MDVLVRPVKPCDRDAWLALRCDLWPDGAADHAGEIDLFLAGAAAEPAAVLVAESAGRLVGLAELSLRPCAEGCGTSPVAYLEGWYVAPALRRRGVGAALIRAFEDWGRLQGCREAASDTQADNEASARAHLALGFQETAPVRCFRKSLDSG